VYAEPNLHLQLLDINPDDTYYSSQWALSTIAAPAGWSVFPGTFAPSPFGAVGIVDTGVDATNPDLQGRISASSATCLGGTCTAGIPTDDYGHGTHVSGIAGAATDNGVGVAGLAYASPLIVVRVFDNSGSGVAALSDVANGIAWAASHGATTINLSLGTYSPAGMPITLCNAVELAVNSYHSVVVAAAGNDAVATRSYPAACPGAVGVAATDNTDATASFSNYGSPNVFVSAPGVNVLSTYPEAFSPYDCDFTDPLGYCTLSGTSMASPFVTALAALIRTEHPEATVGQVRQMLAENSDKLGPGPYVTTPVGTCSTCTWEQHYGYGTDQRPARPHGCRAGPTSPTGRHRRLLLPRRHRCPRHPLRPPTRRLPPSTSTPLGSATARSSDFATGYTTTRARRLRGSRSTVEHGCYGR